MLENATYFVLGIIAILIVVTTIAFIIYEEYLSKLEEENPIFKFSIITFMLSIGTLAITIYLEIFNYI